MQLSKFFAQLSSVEDAIEQESVVRFFDERWEVDDE